MLRKFSIIAVALFGALVFMFAFSTAALASADGPTLCNPTGGSCVWFTANGDVIHVADTACDGYAAAGQVEEITDGIYNNIWNNLGCNTTATYSYGTAMPENRTVYYRPCLGQHIAGDPVTHCNSGWTHGTS